MDDALALRHEGLRVRLAPTRAQSAYLFGCADAARVAYHFALEQITANQQLWTTERDAGIEPAQRTKPLSDRQLQDAWHAKKADVAPWHGTYPSKICLYALRRARAAHHSSMAGRSGFPRFKAKHRDAPAFTLCETITLMPGFLGLPRMDRLGLGPVRTAVPDDHQARLRRLVRRGRARSVSVTLRRDACGTWWAALTIERTVLQEQTVTPRPSPPAGVLGVDVGVKTLAVAARSAGTVVLEEPGSRVLRDAEQRLRRARRALSRKDRCHGKAIGAAHARRSPSRQRERARRRVAELKRRVRDEHQTRLHQLSRRLVGLEAVLVLDDLNVAGMG